MIILHLLVFLLLFQCPWIECSCPSITICNCPQNTSKIVCDGHFGNTGDNVDFPPLSSLPRVAMYIFRNFKEIRSDFLENAIFLGNSSITIRLINVNTIHENAFTAKKVVPNGSTISIEVEQFDITIEKNAFNHIHLKELRFLYIQTFNNRSLFDSQVFGENLQIQELIFEQSGLTGFMDNAARSIQVRSLFIRHCQSFTQLTANTFPAYLETTHSLEIADTGLQSIDSLSLHAWNLELEKLLLKNNSRLTHLPNKMIDGFLMLLRTLDLSNNPIQTIDAGYDWSVYSYAKTLLLRKQRLDLFLKTNMLQELHGLETIDFSDSFIINNNHENDDLFQTYIPDMPKLTLFDISHTNLTQDMLIDLLSSLSETAVDTIKVRLLGHRLDNNSFCSYLNIFRQAPNLLILDLDEDHPCNCVVDLFYRDDGLTIANDYTPQLPRCLLDPNRVQCDIQTAVDEFKCSLGRPNGDDSESNTGLLGNYAFIGLMVGIAVLLVLIGIGSAVVYRHRIKRRFTDADMEDPATNSTEINNLPAPAPAASVEVETPTPIDV